MNHRRVMSLLAVLTLGWMPLASCSSAARSADDAARVALKVGVAEDDVTRLLSQMTPTSSTSSDELLRRLITVEAPPPSAFESSRAWLVESGVPTDVATGVVCETLATAVLDPDGLDAETLREIVIGELASAFLPTSLQGAATAQGIMEDLMVGVDDANLWARVTYLKLVHCS